MPKAVIPLNLTPALNLWLNQVKNRRNSQGGWTVPAPQEFGDAIMLTYDFATYVDSDELMVFESGIYRPHGRATVTAVIEEILRRIGEEKCSSGEYTRAVIAYIKRNTLHHREEFNSHPEWLVLENGILDVDTNTIVPHDPRNLCTIKIPITYAPGITCPAINRFFSEIVSPADTELLWQVLAYCLDIGSGIQRAIMLNGEGGNGKTTCLELFRCILGSENCSGVGLQELSQSPFNKANLYAKVANIMADLPEDLITNTSDFKGLTGGDTLSCNVKYVQAPIVFRNHARLIFSANKLPEVTSDDSYAFWRRWVLVNFPNRFEGGKADKNLLGKLTVASELSGALNEVLKRIPIIRANGDLSYNTTVADTKEDYKRKSSPVYAFVKDCCQLDPTLSMSKAVFANGVADYCKEKKLVMPNKKGLWSSFEFNFPVSGHPKPATRGQVKTGH